MGDAVDRRPEEQFEVLKKFVCDGQELLPRRGDDSVVTLPSVDQLKIKRLVEQRFIRPVGDSAEDVRTILGRMVETLEAIERRLTALEAGPAKPSTTSKRRK